MKLVYVTMLGTAAAFGGGGGFGVSSFGSDGDMGAPEPTQTMRYYKLTLPSGPPECVAECAMDCGQKDPFQCDCPVMGCDTESCSKDDIDALWKETMACNEIMMPPPPPMGDDYGGKDMDLPEPTQTQRYYKLTLPDGPPECVAECAMDCGQKDPFQCDCPINGCDTYSCSSDDIDALWGEIDACQEQLLPKIDDEDWSPPTDDYFGGKDEGYKYEAPEITFEMRNFKLTLPSGAPQCISKCAQKCSEQENFDCSCAFDCDYDKCTDEEFDAITKEVEACSDKYFDSY